MRSTTTPKAKWPMLVALGAALLVALPAAADDVPMVIPYRGYIELDGAAYTGQAQMRFRLYDADENLVWGETYNEDDELISVVDGHFDVFLGALTSTLPPTVLEAESLNLRVYFQEPGGSGFERLYPDQAIVPVPYALWTTASGSLTVNGNLGLGTTATIGGDITVQSNVNINASGYVVAGGTVSAASLDAQAIAEADDAEASVSVTGSITVEDEVTLDGGALRLGGTNAAISYQDSGDAAGIAVGTGQTVSITGSPVFDGRIHASGAITLNSGDVIAEEWRLQNNEPIMLVEYMEWAGSNSPDDDYRFRPNTWDGDGAAGQVSCSNYTCFLAGVKIFNDAFCTGSTSTCGSRELLQAEVYCGSGSVWWVRVTTNAGSPSDYDRQVGVACIPNDYF